MDNQATHEVELNFYYLHYNDCKKFVKWATKEQSKLRSLYARHAILSAVFASEALVNRLFNDFYLPEQGAQLIDRVNIVDKWYSAPLLCGKSKPSNETFDSSRQPFQSFVELVKIRNWLVHPKVGHYITARKDPDSTISVVGTNLQIPWVETLRGEVWPITRIPLNPFELNACHAEKALAILDKMVRELKKLMCDSVTDDWLSEVRLKETCTKAVEKITTESLWGGYTPDEEQAE